MEARCLCRRRGILAKLFNADAGEVVPVLVYAFPQPPLAIDFFRLSIVRNIFFYL